MNLWDAYRCEQAQLAFSKEDLHLLAQTLQNTQPKQEVSPMHTKTYLRPLMAAALILLVAVSAFAVWHFRLPDVFTNELAIEEGGLQLVVDAEHAAPGDVTTVKKEQRSNGLIVTLEAIAQGKSCVQTAWQDENGNTVREDRTYAIVTIRSEDGKPFYGNQDGKGWRLPYQASNFGYNLLVGGYAPNPSTLVAYHEIYAAQEGNVLYRAYDITDARIFADKDVCLVVNDGMCVTTGTLRIDKDGNFYYPDDYTGLRALFDLHLDPALADAAAQAEALRTQPFHTYDEIKALFAADGRDYDTCPAENSR